MRQADSESSDNSLEISSKKLNPGHLISSLSCCFLNKTAQDFLDSYRFWSCDGQSGGEMEWLRKPQQMLQQ